MATKNIDRILHHKSILKGLVILSIPIFLNNLLKSLHDMVDAIFVARMPGYTNSELDAALASLNIYFPVNFLFLSLGIGLSVGTVAIISQYMGANALDKAKSYASKLFFIGTLFSMVIVFILILTSDLIWGYHLIAYAMGARDAALDFASKYFLIRSFDLIFVFMFVMYQAIRQAQGETLKPVVLNGIAIVINIFGTYLFVSVFELGIEGAAYATLFANIVVTPFILYDLMYSKKHLTISLKEIIPNKEVIEDTIHFALPAAFGQSMTAFGFIIIQSLVLAYGTSVSAGFGVASRITMLLLYPIVALSQVNASFIGLNIGHKQQERARQSYIITRRVSLIIMLIGVGIMIPLRGELIGFILGTKTSLSFEIGMEFGLWLLLTQPFMAIFQTFMGVFNGVGMSKYTMWLSLLRLWGMRIPLLLLYPLFIPNASYEAMYVTMMISNILIIPIGLYYESKINFDVKVRLHA